MKTAVTIIILFFFPLFSPIRPDAAPPLQPAGSSIGPEGQTQVEMVSETVTLSIVPATDYSPDNYNPIGSYLQADVQASFTMRNTGTTTEQMNVRFPLMNLDGWGDGYGNFPKVEAFQVWINGAFIEYEEIEESNTAGYEDQPISWAAFPVTFAVNKDVLIEVAYTLRPTGYYPLADFYYLLQTGSGWKGTIGSGDIFLVLPYEVNIYNTILNYASDSTMPAPEMDGHQAHWHFENLEPTQDENIGIIVLVPEAWEAVLAAQASTTANPNDSQAWTDLGNAYSSAAQTARGLIREDTAGRELYQFAIDAYQNALQLDPEKVDAHLNLADIMFWDLLGNGDVDLLFAETILQHINFVLEKEPDNAEAITLKSNLENVLDYIDSQNPEPTITTEPTPTRTVSPSGTPIPEVSVTTTKTTSQPFKCGFIPVLGVILAIYLSAGKKFRSSRK